MTGNLKNSSFGFEAPEDSPGFLLWQTTITWQRLIKKALDAYDISHAQFVIMAVLLWFEEHQERPTQIAIARLSKLDKMTVSKSLKKLVSLGYMSREESQQDTRAKCVRLTLAGKDLASRLVPVVEKIDETFFGALDQNEQKTLIRSLNKLVAFYSE
ncbi:MAG: winged helix-turn-helix transcriptional regulator [Proteobacteria bacterium]|nr:winged helix-turn-helix transcriptional regulator [Pseudomonadota bacterium]